MSTVREVTLTAALNGDHPIDVVLFLGLDLDMDVDTLRQERLWGQRVRQLNDSSWSPGGRIWAPEPPGLPLRLDTAAGAVVWLTRPEDEEQDDG